MKDCFLNFLLIICIPVLLIACNSTSYKSQALSGGSTNELIVDEELLLDIGISVFTSTPTSSQDPSITEIRKAEGIYLAYTLMENLQNEHLPGSVRLIPDPEVYSDLHISGQIINSDGEILELLISVDDASARKWYKKKYWRVTTPESYTATNNIRHEPFEPLYKEISKDLISFLKELSSKEYKSIKDINELKFAQWFMPEVFSAYIETNKNGIYSIKRLPSDIDPYYSNIAKIRTRYDMYIDTQLEDYKSFVEQIDLPYHEWRKNNLNEKISYRQSRDNTTSLYLSGVRDVFWGLNPLNLIKAITNREEPVGIAAGAQTLEEASESRYNTMIHKETLKELNSSLSNQVKTENIMINENIIQLSGNASMRYAQFKEVLKGIYEIDSYHEDK